MRSFKPKPRQAEERTDAQARMECGGTNAPFAGAIELSSPTGDMVKPNSSVTSSARPTRSTLKFLYNMDRKAFISRRASERPGHMRGPSRTERWPTPHARQSDAPSIVAGGKRAAQRNSFDPGPEAGENYDGGSLRDTIIAERRIDIRVEQPDRGDRPQPHCLVGDRTGSRQPVATSMSSATSMGATPSSASCRSSSAHSGLSQRWWTAQASMFAVVSWPLPQ